MAGFTRVWHQWQAHTNSSLTMMRFSLPPGSSRLLIFPGNWPVTEWQCGARHHYVAAEHPGEGCPVRMDIVSRDSPVHMPAASHGNRSHGLHFEIEISTIFQCVP